MSIIKKSGPQQIGNFMYSAIIQVSVIIFGAPHPSQRHAPPITTDTCIASSGRVIELPDHYIAE